MFKFEEKERNKNTSSKILVSSDFNLKWEIYQQQYKKMFELQWRFYLNKQEFQWNANVCFIENKINEFKINTQ